MSFGFFYVTADWHIFKQHFFQINCKFDKGTLWNWLICCIVLISCLTFMIPYLMFKLWQANKFNLGMMKLLKRQNEATLNRQSTMRIRHGIDDEVLDNSSFYEEFPEENT